MRTSIMEHSDESTRIVGLTKGRIEALTDGIFAFAMTLLVTGMDLPIGAHSVAPGKVHEILVGLFPDFMHYIIAFVTLAGFWVAHHVQYHSIRFIDRKLLWINIASLLFVALIPFSTALVGDYPYDSLASIVLEANLLIIGVLFYWQWWYASKDYRLVDRSVGPAAIASGKRRNLVVPTLSVAAIILALLNIPWSTAVYFLVPVLIAVVPSGRARERSD